MQYIIAVIFIILGVFSKRSKVYTICFISFLCVLIGLNIHHLSNSNYYNMDFTNYYTLYLGNENGISGRDIEIGFQFIMVLCNKLGITFNMFRLLISIVGYVLIYDTIKKYTKYINYVFLLYFIFPFLNDAIQIRNFLSMSIIIYAFRYLIENKKNNNIKYILCIIIASSIHITSLFYLIFLLARVFRKRFILGVSIYFSVILVILSYTNLYPTLVSFIIKSNKVISYFDRRTTWGLIIVFGVLIMLVMSFYIMHKKCYLYYLNNITKNTSLKLRKEFLDILWKCNILLIITAPLLVYDFNFIRLYRNILFLNYIVFVHAILIAKKNKQELMIYVGIALFVVGSLFIFFYGMNADTQIWPILNDNMIFR